MSGNLRIFHHDSRFEKKKNLIFPPAEKGPETQTVALTNHRDINEKKKKPFLFSEQKGWVLNK